MTFIETSKNRPRPNGFDASALASVSPADDANANGGDGAYAPPDGGDGFDAEPLDDGFGDAKRQLLEWADDPNLARQLDASDLAEIGQTVIREYEIDERSRADWRQKAEKAMKFATQDSEPKTWPWQGASSVIYPLITQAAISFGARTYPAVIQGKDVVKGVVWGADKGQPATQDGKKDGQPIMGPDGQPVWLSRPGDKRARADRVGGHMSHQLLVEMPEWEAQTDQLLHMIPIVGGAVRKTFRDPLEDCNRSLFVSLMNLTWNYGAPSFEAAPRHSEALYLYPHEVAELERTGVEEVSDELEAALADDDSIQKPTGEGVFLRLSYAASQPVVERSVTGLPDSASRPAGDDPDAPRLYIEQHRRLDLDDDGYPEPYTVTVHKPSSQVVRIVARYDAEGIEENEAGEIRCIRPIEHYTLIPFLPNIEGGSYPMGFGHLLRPLNEAINTTLNQMLDAGTLQNAGGGFISDQLGIPSGQTLFRVGKYVRVTTRGQSIRDSVFPLPFGGPSSVLFELLGVLLNAGKEIAAIQDALSGDVQLANTPPTTLLALIEQGLKVYTAIIKRVFRALGEEFKKLYALNRRYITKPTLYQRGDEWLEVTPEDYRLGGGVEPVADPRMVTDMQRITRAQVLMMFKDDPLLDQIELRRRFLEAANIEGVESLLVTQPPQAMIEQAQLTKAMQLAELGRAKAAEQKDATQALLNMANAKKIAGDEELAHLDQLMRVMEQHLEALSLDQKSTQAEYTHTAKIAGLGVELQRIAADERMVDKQMAAKKAKEKAKEKAT